MQTNPPNYWTSEHNQQIPHYNIFGCTDDKAMDALRILFPNAHTDSMNFVLFSTSGVHGSYTTIEEAEQQTCRGNLDEDGDPCQPCVTFLVVHPRLVCLRYGNCYPQTPDDFNFLKQLRANSIKTVSQIGL
jgi:hypothetical protein